jgi:hypothetical protein
MVTEVDAVIDGLAKTSATSVALIACAFVGARTGVGALCGPITAAMLNVTAVDWCAGSAVALIAHVASAAVCCWAGDAALGLGVTKAVEICTVVNRSAFLACSVVTLIAHAGVFPWANVGAHCIQSTAMNTLVLVTVLYSGACGSYAFVCWCFAQTFLVLAKCACATCGITVFSEGALTLDAIAVCACYTATVCATNGRSAHGVFVAAPVVVLERAVVDGVAGLTGSLVILVACAFAQARAHVGAVGMGITTTVDVRGVNAWVIDGASGSVTIKPLIAVTHAFTRFNHVTRGSGSTVTVVVIARVDGCAT